MKGLWPSRPINFAVAAILLLLVTPTFEPTPALAAAAWSAERPFYEEKRVDLIVSAAPGTSYDLYARLIARNIPRHIAGQPTFIVKNMPGAAGLVAGNWLYNVADRDGLTIAAVHRGLPLLQALGNPQVKYDAARFHWLGTPIQELSACFVRADTSYRTLEDLVKAPKPILMGGIAPGADVTDTPLVLNGVLKTRFKVISGYRSIGAIATAVEQGELEGVCGWGYNSLKTLKSDWLEKGFIRILFQIGREKHPDLPNVSLIPRMVSNPEAKSLFQVFFTQLSLGRPSLTPPGVPEERVRLLRRAFVEVMKDPIFLSEARRAHLEITPLDGDQSQLLVEEILAAPGTVRDRLKEILGY
jgi:hypothetical protein